MSLYSIMFMQGMHTPSQLESCIRDFFLGLCIASETALKMLCLGTLDPCILTLCRKAFVCDVVKVYIHGIYVHASLASSL